MLEKGYGMIPNVVLFDKTISSTAKVLFCYVSSLCADRGYAWALNKHLADKMELSESQVSRLLTSLGAYIEIKDGANERRKICLRKNAEVGTQKAQGGLRKNAGHNNTTINNKPPTPSTDLNTELVKCYELYLKYFIVNDETDFEAAKGKYKLTPGRKEKLTTRLKTNKYKMIVAAIVGYSRAGWSNGNNDRGWKADLTGFICKNYENTERGARLYEDQQARPDGDDAWSKL